MKSVLILSAIAASALPGRIPAQTPAPAAPVAQPLGGPVVPGLCLLARQAVFANAAVGKAATARLQQLAQQAQAEVDTDRKPLDTDLKAYQAEAPKLTPEQRATREQALAPRVKALQDKTQLRTREIEATREKAMAQIATYAQPIIAQVYTTHRCGLLLDRDGTLGGNMANDLTAEVVKGLDAKITTIQFNRETLTAAPATAR